MSKGATSLYELLQATGSTLRMAELLSRRAGKAAANMLPPDEITATRERAMLEGSSSYNVAFLESYCQWLDVGDHLWVAVKDGAVVAQHYHAREAVGACVFQSGRSREDLARAMSVSRQTVHDHLTTTSLSMKMLDRWCLVLGVDIRLHFPELLQSLPDGMALWQMPILHGEGVGTLQLAAYNGTVELQWSERPGAVAGLYSFEAELMP